jgi:hypothetical protein
LTAAFEARANSLVLIAVPQGQKSAFIGNFGDQIEGLFSVHSQKW